MLGARWESGHFFARHTTCTNSYSATCIFCKSDILFHKKYWKDLIYWWKCYLESWKCFSSQILFCQRLCWKSFAICSSPPRAHLPVSLDGPANKYLGFHFLQKGRATIWSMENSELISYLTKLWIKRPFSIVEHRESCRSTEFSVTIPYREMRTFQT